MSFIEINENNENDYYKFDLSKLQVRSHVLRVFKEVKTTGRYEKNKRV